MKINKVVAHNPSCVITKADFSISRLARSYWLLKL